LPSVAKSHVSSIVELPENQLHLSLAMQDTHERRLHTIGHVAISVFTLGFGVAVGKHSPKAVPKPPLTATHLQPVSALQVVHEVPAHAGHVALPTWV